MAHATAEGSPYAKERLWLGEDKALSMLFHND
jgi:hypothetical protein